jgi:hypothetical protein
MSKEFLRKQAAFDQALKVIEDEIAKAIFNKEYDRAFGTLIETLRAFAHGQIDFNLEISKHTEKSLRSQVLAFERIEKLKQDVIELQHFNEPHLKH